MTLVNQNSISGINSITAESGTLSFHDNGGVERVRVSSGLVGIGTNNPSKTLSILSSQSVMLQLQGTSDTARIGFKVPNTNNAPTIGVSDEEDIQFRAGANERLRISSNGNIGINSTSPKTNLDISQKTGAVALPQGTTAQRPSGSAPYIRWNTTNSALEVYNGTNWVELITDYFPTGSVILG